MCVRVWCVCVYSCLLVDARVQSVSSCCVACKDPTEVQRKHFLLVQEAFEILSDTQIRRRYESTLEFDDWVTSSSLYLWRRDAHYHGWLNLEFSRCREIVAHQVCVFLRMRYLAPLKSREEGIGHVNALILMCSPPALSSQLFEAWEVGVMLEKATELSVSVQSSLNSLPVVQGFCSASGRTQNLLTACTLPVL